MLGDGGLGLRSAAVVPAKLSGPTRALNARTSLEEEQCKEAMPMEGDYERHNGIEKVWVRCGQAGPASDLAK